MTDFPTIFRAREFPPTLPVSLIYKYGIFNLKERKVVSNLDARPSDFKFITRQENGYLFYKTYFSVESEFYYLVLAKKQNNARILFITALTLTFALAVVFFTLYLSFISGIKPYKDAKKYMNNFFNDAMHELKTPLGVIGINLEMLGLDNKYVTRSDPVSHSTVQPSRLTKRKLDETSSRLLATLRGSFSCSMVTQRREIGRASCRERV